MKLCLLLMLACCLHASADALAQRVALDVKNAPLRRVLLDISRQSGYTFIFQDEQLRHATPVSLIVNDKEISEVLPLLFNGQPFSYEVSGKAVSIKPTTDASHRRVAGVPNVGMPDNHLVLAFPEVRGKIVDSLGNPLSGASVRVLDAQGKRTSLQTQTDRNGEFVMRNVPEDSRLEISYIGYITKTVSATPTIGQVTLQMQPAALDEVIVNKGYYTESRRLSTGSVGRVDGETIAHQPVTNVMGALIGRVPGLEVVQSGGVAGAPFRVRLRGQNSIAAGNDPLFIVDGVPFSSESMGSGSVSEHLPYIDGIKAISPFNTLNPSDIASIEVLKDADATAIYGSRGSNGVILITTKKGTTGKTQYDFNLNHAANWAPALMETVDTETYLKLRREAFANDNRTTIPATIYDINGTWPEDRYTDWEDELLGGIANVINFQAGVSGGSEHTQFLVRGGYQRETTLFPGDFHYDRGSMLANVSHRSNDSRFTLNLSANYATDNNNVVALDMTQRVQFLAPNAPPIHTADGKINWENQLSGLAGNPLAELVNEYDGDTRNLNTNLLLGYQLTPDILFKTSLGYSDYRVDEFRISPSTQYNPDYGLTSIYSQAYSNSGSRQGWIIEPQVNWTKDFGRAKVQTLLGTTFQQQHRSGTGLAGYGFPSNALIYDLTAASTQQTLGSTDVLYKYNALFGRINFNWAGTYLINLTGRRDGSSRFSPERQFANFGAIGAAWIFTNEPFTQTALPFISFGKLRGSYGLTGNDQIGDYQFLDTYATSGGNNYENIVGLIPQRLYNPNFGWETNRKLEAGAELGFIDDKLYLMATWYRNRSSNQLVGIPLPGTTGFPSIQANLNAEVQNTGWEFEIQYQPVRTGRFTWSGAVNLTIPANELISFPGLASSTYSNTYVVGQPLSIVKHYQLLGIDPNTGIYQYLDANNDGQLSATYDRTAIRDLSSAYYGGLSNNFTFAGFQLDLFFQFVKKTGYNYLYYINQPGMTTASITKEAASSIWRPGSTDATIQVLTSGLNQAAYNAWNRLYASDAAISDFYFIRLKNVALSYQLNNQWLGGIQARVFVQGQNLFTLTDYLGNDPESTLFQNLPPLKTVNLGIQFTL